MKKFLALCLALAIFAMAIPAFGAETADELEKVTLAVKETLDIGDDHPEFSVDKSGNRWYLNWYGGEKEISVTADSVGKIYSYDVYETDVEFYYGDGFKPSFPDAMPESLQAAAEEFAVKVMGEGEEWRFFRNESSGLVNGADECTLTGRIMIGGIPTDIEARITVDMKSLEVVNFYRDDCHMEFLPGDVSSVINIEGDTAKKLLMEKAPLRLVYYVSDYYEPARLVYMPEGYEKYIVRAEDGEVLNIEEHYAVAYGEESAAMDAGGMVSDIKELTEAEKEKISAYEGALSVDDMDKLLREMTELGITEDYFLAGVEYFDYDEDLTASMEYARALSDDEVMERFGLNKDRVEEMRAEGQNWFDEKRAHLNARTGDIEYFDTWRMGDIPAEKADADAYREAADRFVNDRLAKYAQNVVFHKAVVSEGYRNNTVLYTYHRVHNGYPFPDNYLNIAVNPHDGTIDRVNVNWDNTQEFIEDEPAVSAEEATDIYFGAMEFECAYISVPAVQENGYDFTFERTLAWHFNDVYSVYGVDAVTGKPLSYDEIMKDAVLEYSDLDDVPQKEMIEKLALSGVGFAGGKFDPEKDFTVSDMLTIILCMDGETGAEYMNHADKAERAKWLGAGDYSEFDPESGVTGAEFARALVNLAGYGDAAMLTGIYSCGFADEAEIPEADMGAVAIAYALEYIFPDEDGCINAGDILTRANAAEIAFNFLSSEK